MDTVIMIIVLATGLLALMRALPVLTNQRDPGPIHGDGARLRPATVRVRRR
jgi:hypothetical protein